MTSRDRSPFDPASPLGAEDECVVFLKISVEGFRKAKSVITSLVNPLYRHGPSCPSLQTSKHRLWPSLHSEQHSKKYVTGCFNTLAVTRHCWHPDSCGNKEALRQPKKHKHARDIPSS